MNNSPPRTTNCAARPGRADSRYIVVALVAIVALLLPIVPATAQAAIAGIVRDSLRRPIADAEVLIVSPEQRVRTDSSGNFRIGGLAAGTYQLRARRIGYFPLQTKVVLAANTKPIILELERRPVMLDTVNVTASCARFEFAGFACRRRSAIANGRGGVFFDVDAIDSARPRFPIDMVRDVPGLRVVAVRGGLGLESTVDWKCIVVRLANGKPPSRQNPLPVWPNETIGIEAYAYARDVPAEYKHFVDPPHGSCGLVNYWTVVRPRKR